MPTGSNFILGQLNTATKPTELEPSVGNSGVLVRYPGSFGVVGDQFLNSGLLGFGPRGVTGLSFNKDGGVGVAGLGDRIGVAGDSFGGRSIGTQGNADFIGVLGSASTVIRSRNVVGVHGETSNALGFAVNGEAGLFTGVRGMAGFLKPTNSPVGAGVMGIGKMGSQGVVGIAAAPGLAGVFFGDCVINGACIVAGAKAAAVPFTDGSHRILYSVESPESWFEDFGSARLVRGRTRVKLDRGFRGVVRGAYHVFLSPEGECQALYVTNKSAQTFEVRETQGGKSGVRFSYRIVARRKDVAAPRFAKVKLPTMPEGADAPIQPPPAPKAPKFAEIRKRILAAQPRARRQGRRR